MKKLIYSLILSIIVLVPFIKADAYTSTPSLCYYEGWVNNYHAASDAWGKLKLFVDSDRIHIMMDTSYDLNSNDGWGNFGELWNIVVNNGGWDVHTYEFEFERSLTSINRLYDVDDWLLDSVSAMDVIWPNDADRTNLKDKGFCPETISFRCKNGNCLTGDSNYEFIINETQSTTADSGTSGMFTAINFNLTGSKYLTEAQMATIRSYSTTCISDKQQLEILIYNYLDIDSGKGDFFPSSVGAVEKDFVKNWLINNGFEQIAQDFINTYKKGTDCYNNNPDMQDLYDELVNASEEFLYEAGGEDPLKVTSCEAIVGQGTFAYYLNQAFRFIQYLGPVLVIIYSTIEYIKVVASADADLLKKTNKRTITRIVFALLLFLIPIIIKVILNIFGFYGDCLETIL